MTATVLAAVGLTACSEKLDSTGGCPTVCGGQTADVQNETFEAVVLDTTVAGAPGLGSESQMLLVSRGDTVDTRIVIRFDTLPSQRRTSATDTTLTAIDFVDSARLMIRFDSTGRATQPVTLSLYNLETTGNDTAVADLAPLFTPTRLIGQQTFAVGTLVDSIYVKIDSLGFLLSRIMTGQPVRIGVQATSTAPVTLRVYSAATGSSPSMTFRVTPDTTLPRVLVFPRSRTPTDNIFTSVNLADFTLIVKGTLPPPPGFLAVGGLPAQRTYFRFNIPSRIVDSSIVIRATLLLTQQANTGADVADTMRVQPYLVVAGPAVTDPTRAAQLISPGSFPLASLLTRPEETGVREVELAPAFRVWQLQNDTLLPRAVVLGATHEALSPQQILFYDSSNATPELRPRLRVSYTTRTRIGTP